MNNFTVYAQYPSGAEKIVSSHEFEDQAEAAIERYLNAHPSAVCYINDGTVGYCSEAN